jgi:hypothetical protein
MTIAYAGGKGAKLQDFPDINQPVPGTTPVALFSIINAKATRFNSS